MEKYYTAKEVAEMLQVHPRTVHRWIAAGNLKARKVGSCGWRISESALQEMLKPEN